MPCMWRAVLLVGVCLCAFEIRARCGEPGSFYVDVGIEAGQISVPYAPISVELDFAALLETVGASGLFDPKSVRVVLTKPDGSTAPVSFTLSEDFQWKDKGIVSWVVQKPAELMYRVYFDTDDHGPFETHAYVPLIGNGDNFRHNRPGEAEPVHAAHIRPAVGDFNGDGKVDLVSGMIYSSTWGQPWFTVWFWPNVGTNEAPVYGDFVRLYAGDEPIHNHYSGCDLFDWDSDGRLDLVTSRTIYRNTGRFTNRGAPVLELLCDMPETVVKGKPYCFFMGMTDHDRDGVSDAFYLLSGVHYVYEGPPPRNFLRGALYRKVNAAGPGRPPKLEREEPVLLDGKAEHENYVPTGFCDLNGDGALDVVGNNIPLDRIPSIPQNCYWPNVAAKGEPPRYGPVRLIENAYNTASYGIWGVDNAAYRGLLLQDGNRIRYLERTGERLPGQVPGFRDRGCLCRVNNHCEVDGFSGVVVADWENDGDWDIISGDERGLVWLFENVGGNEQPSFETPVALTANGEPMRVMRWHYVQDGNPEYHLGQTKPQYADWDSDGDFDILTANNTNRLVLFENIGSREKPEFARSEVIRVGDNAEAFAWRCRASAVDWNRDGMTDLVAMNKDSQVCLFERYREGSELGLREGRPFSGIDGKPFGVSQIEVCDWDGDGDWDLIGQVGEFGKGGPALYRNVGDNVNACFEPAARMRCWGKEITLSAHEHSFSAVDWYGTGAPDLVCGGESGWFYFFRHPVFDAAAPPVVRVSEVRKMGVAK